MHQTRFSRFGTYLKSIRESRHWPLDRVAQALNTNRANIHRLENARARPRYETVERLVRAMEATPDETTQLFECAGYQAPTWPTTEEDFATIQRDLDGRWLNDGLPATLIIDVYWTVWYANQAFANLFTTRAPADLTSYHVLSLLLDPTFGMHTSLSRVAEPEDINDFIFLSVCRYRSRVASGVGDPKLARSVAALRRLPGFKELWQRAAREQQVPGDHLTASARLRLRGGSDIIMHSATVRRDRRFIYSQVMPADEDSAAELAPYLHR